MSVLRAILGRFARFLVQIARRLDPGLATAPYSLKQERMAALRVRYPGAPDHWLELVARNQMTPAAAPNYDPEPELDPRPEPHARSAPSPRHGTNGRPGRPALRFPMLRRRAAPPVGFAPATAKSIPGADEPNAPPRSVRPEPAFGALRVRDRIANMLRRQRRKAWAAPLFPAEPGRSELGREEFQTMFPSLDSRDARRADEHAAFDDRDSGGPVAQVRWPSRERTKRTETAWPDDAPRDPRYNPRFAAAGNRWPELPALLDEFETPLVRACDEAALLAEQIGGTWSA